MANINEENEVVKNEESIFTDDDFAVDIYNKRIKNAQIAIFAAGGLLLINLIILWATNKTVGDYIWFDIALWTCFIVGFVLLGVWVKKKPYYAIIGALILYAAFIGINALLEISSLWSGIETVAKPFCHNILTVNILKYFSYI